MQHEVFQLHEINLPLLQGALVGIVGSIDSG